MSLNARQSAYNRISHCFSIMYADLQQHQNINDLSLNIHAENFFRDIFNNIYDVEYKNANFSELNSDCIDLVDKKRKKAIQITSTTTSEKIYKTLSALKKPEYSGYSIEVYYLLDKPNFNITTKNNVMDDFGIDVDSILRSRSDILNHVNDLETNNLISLAEKYFNTSMVQYTLDYTLQIVCRHLISEMEYVDSTVYLSDFQLLKPQEKVKINKVSTAISSQIYSSLNFTTMIDELGEGERTDLEKLIVNEIYRRYLFEALSLMHDRKQLKAMSVADLHYLANEYDLELTQVLIKTHNHIKDKMIIKDYNAISMPWIIISYFFEICDIGRKGTNDTTKQTN